MARLHIASTMLPTFYRAAANTAACWPTSSALSCMIAGSRTNPDGRAAYAVQCPPPARTEGARRDRAGLGGTDAAVAAVCLPCGSAGRRSGGAAEGRHWLKAGTDRADRKALRRHCRRRPGVPRSLRGSRPHRGVGRHDLRLSIHRHDVPRFLTDSRVPLTNSLAEPDGPMMKLRLKIYGGLRYGYGQESR